MKRLCQKTAAVFAVIMMLVFAGVMQSQAAEYEAADIDKVMFVGESKSYYGIDYRTENGTKFLSDFDSAVSSNPQVISAVSDGGSFSLEAVGKGTAVVTVTKNDVSAKATVTVYSEDEYGIECCRENRVMQIGEEIVIDDNVAYYYGDTVENTTLSFCTISSSNEDVVSISNGIKSKTLTVRKAGEATITVKIIYPKQIEESFVITVPKKEGASVPVLSGQIETIKDNIYTSVYDDRIYVGINPGKVASEYEIYMSDKKNKGYKKVGWAKTSYDGHFDEIDITASDRDSTSDKPYGEIVAIEIKKFNKKKLKANKKYFVKVRVRYTDSNHIGDWTGFSNVKEYWTAPSNIPKKKIKYNSKTGKLSFPKVKNVAGYQYGVKNFTHIGYNVFGGRVYFSETRTARTTKTSFVTKKVSKSSGFGKEVAFVAPYAKHNGYYYMSGKKPFKKLKNLDSYDGHRWAASP